MMATGETGFDDVSFDLVSVQYHALKAGHDRSRVLLAAVGVPGENGKSALLPPSF